MKPSANVPSVALFTALTAAVFTAGCSAKVKSPAIGSWRAEGSSETVEFRNDGTVRAVDKYGRPSTGSFEFLDPDRVRMKMTTSSVDKKAGVRMVDNAEGICRLQVHGDLLTLTEENGTANHYRRSK